jgi:NAD(P)-dependent dehydrogenase (short-subunit alcohol dehydrogenase family)
MSENQEKPFSLAGQLGLITGGGTGIGLGIAQAFVAQGARVVITGRRVEPLAQAVAVLGPAASYRVHDVTQYDASEPLIQSIEEQHGPLTALVNNAGNQIHSPAEDFSEEAMQQILDVHLLGAFSLSRHSARRMMKRGQGSILYIASMASLMGIPNVSAYAAAKTAQLGLVRTLAAEWSGRGVRINAIAPGWILTEMSRIAFENNPDRKAKVLGRTPMQQLGEPADIGWTAAFLASPAAKFITGTCLPVDGGASIGF